LDFDFTVNNTETKTFNGNDNNVSVNYIMAKFNKGEIHEIDLATLQLLDKYLFLTNNQLTTLLTLKGISLPNRKKFLVKLQSLIKERLITRYSINNSENKFLYNVYCLDKNGYHLLIGRDIHCTWKPELNIKPIYYIKQKLISNQLFISYMQNKQGFYSAEPRASLLIRNSKRRITLTNGIIKISENDSIIKYIVDSVRKTSESLDKFILRLEDYDIILDNANNDYYNNYKLLIIAEDKNHILEIYKAIKLNAPSLPDNKIFFTTDELLNKEDLKHTLINVYFDDDSSKYNINII